VDKNIASTDMGYFWEYVVNDNMLVMPCLNANAVVRFNLDTDTSMVHEIGNKGNCYHGICFDGNNFWITPLSSGAVIKWNPELDLYKEYTDANIPPSSVQSNSNIINYVNGKLWLSYKGKYTSYIINSINESLTSADFFQSDCEKSLSKTNQTQTNELFLFSKVINDIIYAHTKKSNRFLAYDTRIGKKNEKIITISNMEKVNEMKQVIFNRYAFEYESEENFIIYENTVFSLNDLTTHVCQNNPKAKTTAFCNKQLGCKNSVFTSSDGSAGKAIYLFCKRKFLEFDLLQVN
jgi:hypothetical protein